MTLWAPLFDPHCQQSLQMVQFLSRLLMRWIDQRLLAYCAVCGSMHARDQVGTPPQPAVVLVDTGSDLTWFQCKPCTQCFNQTRTDIFEPAKSSTYSTVSCVDATCQAVNNLNLCSAGTCQYSIVYLDRTSTTGPVSTDTMTTEPVQGGGTSGTARSGGPLVQLINSSIHSSGP